MLGKFPNRRKRRESNQHAHGLTLASVLWARCLLFFPQRVNWQGRQDLRNPKWIDFRLTRICSTGNCVSLTMTFQLEGHLEDPVRGEYNSLVFHFDENGVFTVQAHTKGVKWWWRIWSQTLLSLTENWNILWTVPDPRISPVVFRTPASYNLIVLPLIRNVQQIQNTLEVVCELKQCVCLPWVIQINIFQCLSGFKEIHIYFENIDLMPTRYKALYGYGSKSHIRKQYSVSSKQNISAWSPENSIYDIMVVTFLSFYPIIAAVKLE